MRKNDRRRKLLASPPVCPLCGAISPTLEESRTKLPRWRCTNSKCDVVWWQDVSDRKPVAYHREPKPPWTKEQWQKIFDRKFKLKPKAR